MNFPTLTLKRLLAGAAALAFATSLAQAQTPAPAWPNRHVTVVVPFPAGGNTDTMARLASEFLTKRFGETFIVENRPTAGGVVAAAQIAKAPADGYTLFFATASQMVILPMLQKVNYNPDADFKAVSILGAGPFVLGMRSALPVKTFEEFLGYARASKTKLNVSSAGMGSIGHLTSALLAKKAGFELVFVPYQGGGPAMNALLNGDVDMYFGNASELLSQMTNDRIRILAVSTEDRMKQLPDTPAVAAAYPGFKTSSWNGFLVAKNTPQDIVDKLAAATIAASKDPKIVDRLDALGIKPIGSTPAELEATIAAEKPLYKEAIDAAGLTMAQ
ncbi:MAG: transporter substrate-binding protein [Hyphomicrobiales bacterium]|nr:transporter substrate-binding protein [Hyphomicrobiales bacterium]